VAYLHRLIAVFALLFTVHAQALVPAQTTFTWSFGSSSGTAATAAEACSAGAAQVEANSAGCTYYGQPCTWQTSFVNGVCDAIRNGNTSYRITIGTGPASCPADSTPVAGGCQCNAGTVEVDGRCENEDKQRCATFLAVNTLPGGALVQDYRLQGNVADGAQFCMPGAFSNQGKGCKVSFQREAFLDYGAGNQVTEGQFSGASNASSVDQSCTVGEGNVPPKVPPPEKCKDGYTGTVNGVEVCVSKKPDSGVGGPEGDETSTDDGTETTTRRRESRTECKDGNCTTTTTTTTTRRNNSTGATTTSSSTTITTQAQPNFCKENPGSKLCKEGDEDGSSFGGACTGGFTCEGDAIQCAIAREQHTRACKLFDTPSPESQLYDANKNKTGNQTGGLPGNETISIASRINTGDSLTGASCIGDINTVVWGAQITLPVSGLCPYLEMLGNVLVAVSMLVAAKIIFRG